MILSGQFSTKNTKKENSGKCNISIEPLLLACPLREKNNASNYTVSFYCSVNLYSLVGLWVEGCLNFPELV